MKSILTFLFSLTLILSGQAQLLLNLVNPKTNQWISRNGVSKHYSDFELVTKTSDTCVASRIKISTQREMQFIDSLKKVGFKDKYSLIDKKKEYKVTVSLVSYSFSNIIDNDSLFKFHFIITLINSKTNKAQKLHGQILNHPKQKTIKAFAENNYTIDNISIIKNTSIITLWLCSETIFGPSRVFAPCRSFYF